MDNTRTQLNQALRAIKQKDYAQARTILKAVINSNPGEIEAWLMYARVAPNKEQARQCLERALTLNPNHPLGLKMMRQLMATESASQRSQSHQPQGVLQEDIVHRDSSAVQPTANEVLRKKPSEEKEQGNPEGKTKKTRRQIKPIWGILIVSLICLAIAGGTATFQYSTDLAQFFSNAPTPTSDELYEVISRNMRAANSEDMDEYMKTIHTKSPLYRQTEEALRMAFSTYDLSYTASALRVDKVSRTEAEVLFTLTTRKISGPAFRDNVIEGRFVMRPENGEWKIFNQEIIDVTYLN